MLEKKQLSLQAHGAEKPDKRRGPCAQQSKDGKSPVFLLATRRPLPSHRGENIAEEKVPEDGRPAKDKGHRVDQKLKLCVKASAPGGGGAGVPGWGPTRATFF